MEMVFKILGIERESEVDTGPQELKCYFDDYPNQWK